MHWLIRKSHKSQFIYNASQKLYDIKYDIKIDIKQFPHGNVILIAI